MIQLVSQDESIGRLLSTYFATLGLAGRIIVESMEVLAQSVPQWSTPSSVLLIPSTR